MPVSKIPTKSTLCSVSGAADLDPERSFLKHVLILNAARLQPFDLEGSTLQKGFKAFKRVQACDAKRGNLCDVPPASSKSVGNMQVFIAFKRVQTCDAKRGNLCDVPPASSKSVGNM